MTANPQVTWLTGLGWSFATGLDRPSGARAEPSSRVREPLSSPHGREYRWAWVMCPVTCVARTGQYTASVGAAASPATGCDPGVASPRGERRHR